MLEQSIFTTSEGNNLCYYVFGEGERTIVMLHAQGTSSESYFEAAERLSKSARVILIDYYGHGVHNGEDILGCNIAFTIRYC